MKRTAAVILAILIGAIIVSALPSACAGEDKEPSPQDRYPDADIIITESVRGVSITTRNPNVDGGYSVRTVASGSSLRLADLSDIDGSLSVVMDGGTLGELTLVQIDVYDPGISDAAVSFRLVSGSIDRLCVASVQSFLSSRIPQSYFDAWIPFGEVDIDLSGNVGEFRPTSSLIGVSSLEISVCDGARIDRLFPSGEDGFYRHIGMTMTGGTVGYVSNQSSVVEDLSYDLIRGRVDYLCLGADTEGGAGYYMANLWSFYAVRSASIDIGDLMDIGSMILGAGLADVPSVLCSGESPMVPVIRDIRVDAGDHVLKLDRSFCSAGSKVFRLTGYSIGSTPSESTPRVSYYRSYSACPVYGDGGVWDSAFGASVDPGTVFHLTADAVIGSYAAFLIQEGGILFNASAIQIHGTMENSGSVRNGGLIEERGSGLYSGSDPEGDGIVAQCIESSSSERIDVMTVTRCAVTLRGYSGEISFNRALVIVEGIKCSLLLSAPEGLYIKGDPVVISVEETRPEGGWTASWKVYVSVADSMSSSLLSISLTVPIKATDGYEGVVSGPDGRRMTVTDTSESGTTFRIDGNGVYSFGVVQMTDGGEDKGILGDPLVVNTIVAVFIVVLASTVVYLLLRKSRGPGPSSPRLLRCCRGREGRSS